MSRFSATRTFAPPRPSSRATAVRRWRRSSRSSFIGPRIRRYISRDKIANLRILLEHRNSPGTGARECASSALETEQGRCQLAHGVRCRGAVEDDHIRRIADGETVVLLTHQSGRPMCDHLQALAQSGNGSDLSDVGVQIGHAHHGAVAERGEGIEHVVGRQCTVDTVPDQAMHRRNTANDVVISIRSHQKEIPGRQHRHRDPGRREPRGDFAEPLAIEGLELAHVTDGDPASVAVAFRQLADVVHGHAVGDTDVGRVLVRTPRHPAVFHDQIDDSSSRCGSSRRCTW